MHEDELAIDAELARALIRDRFPHWAGEPVTPVAGGGTVHAIFRIGDELAARFPRRPDDPSEALRRRERENAAATEFAAVSTVPSPLPVADGTPGRGYPLPWSVWT